MKPTIKVMLLCCGVALSGTSLQVTAKPEAKVILSPYTYQRWNKTAMGHSYPEDGPVVRVFAEGMSDRYSHVADVNDMRQAWVTIKGRCEGRKTDKTGVSARVGKGPYAWAGKGSGKGKDIRVEIPYSEFESLDAVKVCNVEAKNLSVKNRLPLADVVQKGFAVRMNDALAVIGETQCKKKGVFTEFDDARMVMNTDAWVVCEANPMAGRARAGAPKTRAGEKRESAKAMPKESIPVPRKAVEVKAAPAKPVVNAAISSKAVIQEAEAQKPAKDEAVD